MIAPTRRQRAEMGPAGYKDSMRPRAGLDMEDQVDAGADEGTEDGGEYTITVPAHCLDQGDGSSGLNPGDTVDFDAEAQVVSAEDDKVTIKIKSINGEACDGSGSDTHGDGGGGMGGNTNESTADMGARLRSKLPNY